MTRQPLPAGLEDRYELGELLGRGGTAQVYRARDRRSGSAAAVKVVDVTAPSARLAAQREIDALLRLDDVPGVVSLVDHGANSATCWLALECFDTSLADRIAAEGALSSAEVRALGVGLAHTLSQLHERGIVHGDLKPSNVFIDANGRVAIGDLGTARIDIDPTLTGPAPLSLQWAAPETIETGTTDPASDLYGLGAILHAARTGSPPVAFQEADGTAIPIGPALRLVTSGERRPLTIADDPELAEAIEQLLAIDASQRPASAQLVAHELGHTTIAPGPKQRTRTPAIALAAITFVVLAAVSALAATALRSDPSDDDPTTVSTVDAASAQEWFFDGDGAVATIARASLEQGEGFIVRPSSGAEGGAALAQSIAGLGDADAVSIRVRVRVSEIVGTNANQPWFQTLVRLDDELGNQWSVNASSWDGELTFNTGYFALPEMSGGANASEPSTTNDWHCVELVVQRDNPTQQLWIDARRVVALDDADAAWSGNAHVVRIGAVWLEAGAAPPTVELANLSITEIITGGEDSGAPLGC